MSSADGSAFYEAMQEVLDGSAVAILRTLCSEFRGATDDGSVCRCGYNRAPFFGWFRANVTSSQGDLTFTMQSIKLQNLSNDFTKPNILDIKLGTQLYAEDASPKKKQWMVQTAMKTTSLELALE